MRRNRKNKAHTSMNKKKSSSIASVKRKISRRRACRVICDFEKNASDEEIRIAKDKANAVVSHMTYHFRYGMCLIKNGEYRVIEKFGMKEIVYLSVLYGIDCAKQSMTNRIKK